MTTDMQNTTVSTDPGTLSMAQHPDIVALSNRPALPAAATSTVYGLALLAGSYAAISAWVVGFSGQSALAVPDLIVGGAIAVLAVLALRERIPALAPAAALMGVWLVIAPWAVQNLDRSTGLIVSNVITGAVVAFLGLAGTVLATVYRHRH